MICPKSAEEEYDIEQEEWYKDVFGNFMDTLDSGKGKKKG